MALQVISIGSGLDLSLLHGWGFGRGVWKEVAIRLATRYRVHLISLPGYDGSAFDMRDFDDTASAITEAVPVGSFLCGWSMGGMLSLKAAASHPSHFTRIVLVGTTPKFVQATDWKPAQIDKSLDIFLRWVMQAPTITLENFCQLLSRNDARSEHISQNLEHLLARGRPAASALKKGLIWLRDIDLRQVTDLVTLPTLVVHGEQDPLIPSPAAVWLASALPNSRLHLYPGTGHAPFASNLDHFCEMLAEFFSEPI